MSNYVISCCSTADLTKEHFEKRNISYICFHYELNGQQYADDLGQSMPFDQFYKAMQDGATTKTSQINADEFTEYFEGFLKEGKDILHVCLSSGITGVVNSANIAREELSEKYPDRKICCAKFDRADRVQVSKEEIPCPRINSLRFGAVQRNF